jgi:hypothetical protein
MSRWWLTTFVLFFSLSFFAFSLSLSLSLFCESGNALLDMLVEEIVKLLPRKDVDE